MEDSSSEGSSRNSESNPESNQLIISFIQSTETRKVSYRHLHEEIHAAFRKHPALQDGVLMDTLERGVGHPVLHLKQVSEEPDVGESELSSTTHLQNQFLTIRQGLYREIHRMALEGGRSNPAEGSGFIVLGFKRFEGSIIDNTWRDWSGARFIYLNLDDTFEARSIVLYRRSKPDDIDLFNYVLLVRCDNLTDDNIPALLDFVQRLRVKKVGAYVAAYEITSKEYGS